MMVKELRIKVATQGNNGVLKITVNADINREMCLELMTETLKTMPDATVCVPMHVVDVNDKVRSVDSESTIKALVANNINVGVIAVIDKEQDLVSQASSTDQETAFSALEEMLNKASETIVKEGGQSYITKLMNMPDTEVYGALLTSLEEIKQSNAKKMIGLFGKGDLKKAKKVIAINEVAESLVSATDTLLEGTTDKASVMTKVKALAALIFKKVVALLKGVLSFTFDTTTILGTAIGRVSYHTARELVYAGKAIGQAFNKDIIQSVKNA